MTPGASGGARGQAADHREGEREHEHEDLRDDHHLDRRLEAVPDLRQRSAEVPRAGEVVDELVQRVHACALARYLNVGRLLKLNENHFFCSFAIVPSAVSSLIALFTDGASLLPFRITAPYCSWVTICPATGPKALGVALRWRATIGTSR